jgi:Fic-DOC domain mobile mystery protein B
MMRTPTPGETPIDDLSGLKVKGISLRKELSALEAENIRKATQKYFVGRLTRKKARLDYAWLLRLHKEMFGDVWTWAGRLRGHDTNIGVSAQHIESMLFELLKDMEYWKKSPWSLQAAMLHHRAVSIHPFANGNGRWARMLANIWLRLNKQPHCVWPEETVGDTSVIRKEYLKTLHAADQGDYDPLQELHQRFTPATGE